METASFRLEDFTRLQWAPQARHVWEPRFQQVSRSWQNIEIDLVGAGFKAGALLVVPPERMADVSRLASTYGLVALVLAQQGRGPSSYASTTAAYVEGASFDYRVAICKAAVTSMWTEAWKVHDDEAIGVLLGYPECCRRFFKDTWVAKELVDTTWAQALNTGEPREGIITIHPDPACNVTLRHLGLRWVSHLPCSFKCEATRTYVEGASKLIRANFFEEYRTLSEALQWPVKWTALHGIAEIVTPVCRIISRTDATYTKNTILQHGALYPNEGARGNEFPFRNNTTKVKFLNKDTWTLNGFGSFEAMVAAHNLVVAAAQNCKDQSIIDLGCGTGELLKIYKDIASELHGIESNDEAFKKAQKIANVRCMNIFDPRVFDRKYDVAFISVQRFIEAPNQEQLLERLRTWTKATVFYSYGEMEGWKVIKRTPDLLIGPNSAQRVDW
jgi:hypothetical protein